MQGSIVNQGVELMLFGMGTVLVFLTLLVLAIALMSWILQRYYPEVEPAPGAQRPVVSPVSSPIVGDANLVAAITAAIHKYRAKRPNN